MTGLSFFLSRPVLRPWRIRADESAGSREAPRSVDRMTVAATVVGTSMAQLRRRSERCSSLVMTSPVMILGRSGAFDEVTAATSTNASGQGGEFCGDLGGFAGVDLLEDVERFP
jgi:hypothetical protein